MLSNEKARGSSRSAPRHGVERREKETAQAVNQFVRLLKHADVRENELDFSCGDRFERNLTGKADALLGKLEASLSGIITRVDVDNLSLLKLCVGALVSEGAFAAAVRYAEFAEDWCRKADFTDSVATGTALSATAEMFASLNLYGRAARLCRRAAVAFDSVLDSDHPLAARSRRMHRLFLTKLALDSRKVTKPAYGAGYLKRCEPGILCPLVWDGPIL